MNGDIFKCLPEIQVECFDVNQTAGFGLTPCSNAQENALASSCIWVNISPPVGEQRYTIATLSAQPVSSGIFVFLAMNVTTSTNILTKQTLHDDELLM